MKPRSEEEAYVLLTAMGPVKTGAESRLRKRRLALLTSPTEEPEEGPSVLTASGKGVQVIVCFSKPTKHRSSSKPRKNAVTTQLHATIFGFCVFMASLLVVKRGVVSPLIVGIAAVCRALVLASSGPPPDII